MTATQRIRARLAYWPHMLVGLGMMLNGVGLATGKAILIGGANNLLVVGGLILAQRKRNGKKDV